MAGVRVEIRAQRRTDEALPKAHRSKAIQMCHLWEIIRQKRSSGASHETSLAEKQIEVSQLSATLKRLRLIDATASIWRQFMHSHSDAACVPEINYHNEITVYYLKIILIDVYFIRPTLMNTKWI